MSITLEELKVKAAACPPGQLPVVGYCRKSTTGQREESIEAQERAIVTYCTMSGYYLLYIFKDHGNSGRRGERPDYQTMMELAAGQLFSAIVVHKLDRWYRNADQQTVVELELKKHGVRVLSASERFDDTPQGQFMRNVTKAINQWYSANLAQEVKKGQTENALTARSNGGIPPLGYNVGPDGKYLLNEQEAETVRLIFRLYLQGYGYGHILAQLNQLGLKTKRGATFGKNSLYDILRNERYTGVYIWGRTAYSTDGTYNRHRIRGKQEQVRVENGMPRIIDPQDFEIVQSRLDSNRHRPGAVKAAAFYLLSGMVYCGSCHAPMTGELCRYKSHGTPVEYRYYTCSQRKRKPGSCDMRRVRADLLEETVLRYLQKVIFDPANMERLCEAVIRSMDNGDEILAQNKALKKQEASLSRKLENLYKAIEDGLATADTIRRANAISEERENVRVQLAQLEASSGVSTRTVEQLKKVWGSIRLDDLPPEEKREAIRRIVSRIYVFRDGPRNHRIRIILNPTGVDLTPYGHTLADCDTTDFSSYSATSSATARNPHRKVWVKTVEKRKSGTNKSLPL